MVALGGVAACVLLVVAGAVIYGLVRYFGIERIGDLGVDAATGGEPRNYLVVGSDARAGEEEVPGQRSDMVMVVRVDPEEGRASLLSVPRDLVVPIAGTGETGRINGAYAEGRAMLLDTVRENLDIEINHYVEIDFSSFEELVDSAGGVPVWVDAAVKDEASGLYVPDLGCVVLNGEQSLAYVRSRQIRHMTEAGTWSAPDPTADLGRMDRQQLFVRRAVAHALSRARSSPEGFRDLVDLAAGSMAIDEEMSLSELLDLADQLREFDPDDVETHVLPSVPRDDGATLALDQTAAEPVLDRFRSDGSDDREPSGGSESDGGPADAPGPGDDGSGDGGDAAAGDDAAEPTVPSPGATDGSEPAPGIVEPPEGASCP